MVNRPIARPIALNHVAILRCDVYVFQVFCFFSDINISQGSVAMRLSRGGMFYYCPAGNLLPSLSVKEF